MSESQHYKTASRDKVSITQMSAYAVGMLVNNLQAAALPAMMIILNLGLGLDVVLVGIIGFAPRIFDAISDPMMGFISDNTRTRWGRRRPYIFFGAILAGIIFALMWQLPSGYVDLLAQKPIAQHNSVIDNNTNIIFQQDGQIIVDYSQDQPSESGIILYGPKQLAIETESTQAADFSEYSSLEINAEIPEDLSMQVLFNEPEVVSETADINGTPTITDGKSFYITITSNQFIDGVCQFDFKDLKPHSTHGNQNKKKQLETQAVRSITVLFPELQGKGTININSVKLKKDRSSDFIDLLTEASIKQHVSLLPEDTTTRFKDNGETTLSYQSKQKTQASLVFYGPQPAPPEKPELGVNLDEYSQVEINVDMPQIQTFSVNLNESADSDGESYYIDLTLDKSDKEEGKLYEFKLAQLKKHSSLGNQNGNSVLDIEELDNVTFSFSELKGPGSITISSLKLKKSDSFFAFYFWYFMAMSVFFFLAYTVYATPFVAFGYEMTPDYHERTRLHAFANTVGQVAWLGVPWFYAIMANETLFRDKVHGARTLAIYVGFAVALLGIVPAIFCRERFGSLPKIKTEKGVWENTVDFFSGIRTTFKCKPFVKLCTATFLVFNGFQLGISFSIYIMIFYLFNGNDSSAGKLNGWFGTITSACTLAVIPLTALISTKLGKRRTFLLTISLSIAGYALKWFGYNPAHPYWLLVAAPFVAFGTGSLFTLMGSMIADVCDFDELKTNQRREGVFGAIYWWMVKVGMALAMLLTGFMLKASGFNEQLTEQSENTMFMLRIFDVGVPLATSAIALIVIYKYTISEERAHEIRMKLEARRGKLGE